VDTSAKATKPAEMLGVKQMPGKTYPVLWVTTWPHI